MKRKSFVYLASFVIIILGILSINSGQVLRGSSQTFQNYWKAMTQTSNSNIATAKTNAQGQQEVTITATSNGYSLGTTALKSGIPVKLTVVSNNVLSCAKSFLIPSLGISKILPQNGNTIIDFTPSKTGALAYTCGMGMYTGSFTVI